MKGERMQELKTGKPYIIGDNYSDPGKELLTLEGPILKCGALTRTNRIYPRNVVKKAIREYKKAIREGTALGKLSDITARELKLDNTTVRAITHRVLKLYLKEDTVYVHLVILASENGDIVRTTRECGYKYGAYLIGIGNVTFKDGKYIVTEGYKINNISLQLIK
jgi:hypothetical protein